MESIVCYCTNVSFRVLIHGNKFYAVCGKCGASIELTLEGFLKYSKILETLVEKELDNIIEEEDEEDIPDRGVAYVV
jgi:transcription elongation factor Elf1